MFTVCPKCALTLAVTAADLRAGQGYVRCGRCANVFNALLGLKEEPGPASSQSAKGEAPPDSAMENAAATASRPSLELPDGAENSAPATPAPSSPPALRLIDSPPRPLPPVPPIDTPDNEWEVEEYQATGSFETIVLEGDTFLQTEEMIPEEALDIEIADVSRLIAAAHGAAAAAATATATATAAGTGAAAGGGAGKPPPESSRDTERVEQSVVLEQLRRTPRARISWPMLVAVLLLTLLLLAQLLNHWRNELATRSAWYAPISRVAALLGEPLRPHWDLNAYDVRQLGTAADSSDGRELRVRLSLANIGPQRQGLPLLRLTLLDRYGKTLASSEFKPEQYLPSQLRGQQFIAHQQRIDTEVIVVDGSQQASSFELDVCVAAAGGGLRCASDAPLVASQS